ncbi:MAG: hypothetical protein QXZ02_07070 [Candidatus Bathyarchaeia archaeon]
MWKVWRGKNLNLEALTAKVVDFFEKKGCVCASSKGAGKFKIYVKPPQIDNTAMVTIRGSPENFKVEFVWRRNLLQFFTNFASLFGGGIFVSRATRSIERDNLDRFEDEFWIFVEDVVMRLSGTPKLK